jgi:hypothetical protein
MGSTTAFTLEEKRGIAGCLYSILSFPVYCVNVWISLALWRWFVVPLGAMDLGYWHMLGLTGLLSALTKNISCEKESQNPWGPLTLLLLSPVARIAFGAVAHWGMTQ